MGFSAQRLGIPLGRRNPDGAFSQWIVPFDRWWQHLDGDYGAGNKGFPKKPYGRLAVAIAPSKSQRVYAFVESPESALFVSDDGGATWEKRDKSQWMVWRPFYFANLIVDPKNPDRVFKTDGALIVSEDGGKSFAVVGGFQGAHGDAHDVWIDPTNPQIGLRGRRWRDVVFLQRRQQMVERRKPAGLAVLSRERGR